MGEAQNGLCIVILAHNQEKLVRQEIRNISVFNKDKDYRIVIVDNDSQDSLPEWLRSQTEIDYILCEGGIENYAAILNAAIREFVGEDDLLVLSPNMLVLPECIGRLHQALYLEDGVGAVCVRKILANTEGMGDFKAASDYALNNAPKERLGIISLGTEAFLIRNRLLKAVGEFDEGLFLPENVLMDFSFCGIRQGFHFYEVQDACVFQIAESKDCYVEKYGEGIDRGRLKGKWGMNYFNRYPNQALLSMIKQDRDAAFSVLEVGCDCGANLLQVRNLYKNADVYGIEINPNSAEIASHIATVHTGNIEDGVTGFGDMRFDYVMFGDVLEHLGDPECVLRKCEKVLKNDGAMIACIPNIMHYSVVYDLLNGNFTYTDMGLLDRTHIHFFTFREIIRMFGRIGFLVDGMFYTGGKGIASEQEKRFVDSLMSLPTEAEEFMYYAFQYIISARRKS